MTCKKCGAEVANENMFCTQCGYQFLPPLPKATYMYYIAAMVLSCLLPLWSSPTYSWFSSIYEWLVASLAIPFMAMILFCFIPLFNFKKMVPGIIIVSIIIIKNSMIKNSMIKNLIYWWCIKRYGFDFDERYWFSLRARVFIFILMLMIIEIALLFLTVCLLKKFRKCRLYTYIIVSVYALLATADIVIINILVSPTMRSESIIIYIIGIALCLLGLYLGELIHSWLSQKYDI